MIGRAPIELITTLLLLYMRSIVVPSYWTATLKNWIGYTRAYALSYCNPHCTMVLWGFRLPHPIWHSIAWLVPYIGLATKLTLIVSANDQEP